MRSLQWVDNMYSHYKEEKEQQEEKEEQEEEEEDKKAEMREDKRHTAANPVYSWRS